MQYTNLFQRTAALCLFSILPAIGSAASFELAGLPNLQKVNEFVYRGAQPSDAGFAELSKLGIKTVIDLRWTGEHSQAGEEKAVQANSMKYVSIPMKGMSTPSADQVRQVLALLNNADAQPVFVHCQRGADRTGAVIACYRILHDHWKNDAALQEARSYGMSWFQKALQHYVMKFQPETFTATALQ
jgi:uncharacterized protein (TIGR01244 family)